ncbi:MAG: alpha/beta hydrolase family protein [Myxococcales bacterium]|nr:alpha/beta hydrolase family protein [Myxococcales bacterium]
MRRWFAQVLDGVVGWFGRAVLRRAPRTPNTLGELAVFRDRSPEELFPAPGALPPVRVDARWRWRGLEGRYLTFPSLHEPLPGPFRRLHASAYQALDHVPVRWVVHQDGGPRPTMLFVHGWMQPDSFIEEVTFLPYLARRLGMNIARMTLPYHGPRRPRASRIDGDLFWTADLPRTAEAIRQSVLDVRTLFTWLEAQGNGPVGLAGMSLGGMVAQAVACFDTRPAFVVPIAAHLDLAGVLEDAMLLEPMRDELRGYGWGPAEVDDYLASLGLKDLLPRVPLDRVLFAAGRYDRFLSAHRVEAQWDRWGRPAIHWFPGGHLGAMLHVRGVVGAMENFFDGLGLGRESRPPALLVNPSL